MVPSPLSNKLNIDNPVVKSINLIFGNIEVGIVIKFIFEISIVPLTVPLEPVAVIYVPSFGNSEITPFIGLLPYAVITLNVNIV